ncbi:hypothetical protein KL86CLO1_12359 [uncultured Eubacteriales bacterium]|uniref:Uncharacterized protein n=1 Tax=uncultured Eubacteriales bacterium TaxID=172733 RepID=A0A212K849_9FIRM|nr:hypothetical protein KL86CLO1_12359 [uncultured Eubacteriales bacterium]
MQSGTSCGSLPLHPRQPIRSRESGGAALVRSGPADFITSYPFNTNHIEKFILCVGRLESFFWGFFGQYSIYVPMTDFNVPLCGISAYQQY